jgi:hypothetical protein
MYLPNKFKIAALRPPNGKNINKTKKFRALWKNKKEYIKLIISKCYKQQMQALRAFSNLL